ncbi:MAG TPA: NAD(P)/FAD-dependent oxidoreductase [Verrucomicrobiae bacterium]|nr:NAD(P)/FAD-dependent oxidoreductase [Verrucomicrobiae bacterium]
MKRGRFDTDVFVIGGGAAGLSVAIAARQEGFRVSMADSGAPANDDSCGDVLMPAGVAALRKLGVGLGLNDGMPFRGLRFVERRVAAQADFPDGWGRGVRWATLHKLLIERAWRVGVEMNWGVRVRSGQAGELTADGSSVRSRWIIGADGKNSRVRNWAGLGVDGKGEKRRALRRHYRVKPWSEHAEVHWSAECQMYVTPAGAADVCVAAFTRKDGLKFEEALARFPEIAARVAAAESGATDEREMRAARSMRHVFNGNIALAGDASGCVDALTGDGLALALQQGVHLASALRKNDLRGYQREHRRMMQRPKLMSRLLEMLSRRGWLRRRLISALSVNPAMFSRLLAAHAGTMNLQRLVLDYAPEFTWQVLTAHDASSPNEANPSRFDGR